MTDSVLVKMRLLFVLFIIFSISSCKAQSYDVIIDNPYKNITSKVRHRAMSHEHITQQTMLEDAINRGVDVLCISNYSPAVPAVPVTGFSGKYIDWEFVKDEHGNIIYEKDSFGNSKTKRVGPFEYRIPLLRRVEKTYNGGFEDFNGEDGTRIELSKIPQLPNVEITHFTWSDGVTSAGDNHINIIGSLWCDAVNGSLDSQDLRKYNEDNHCSLTNASFRIVFPLWSIKDIVTNAKNNLLFPNMSFGTINHPGYSRIQDWQVDEIVEYGKGIFKGMSIYNNSVSEEDALRDGVIYDHTLNRGINLWCVAEDDWGRVHNLNNPEHRGCNLMYLDKEYELLPPEKQAKMVLEAYISGSFSAVGYGTIDLLDVNVKEDIVDIIFNCVPDRTIVDIDGKREEGGSVTMLSVNYKKARRFIRVEAYKGDDFIFTQPFFISKRYYNSD